MSLSCWSSVCSKLSTAEYDSNCSALHNPKTKCRRKVTAGTKPRIFKNNLKYVLILISLLILHFFYLKNLFWKHLTCDWILRCSSYLKTPKFWFFQANFPTVFTNIHPVLVCSSCRFYWSKYLLINHMEAERNQLRLKLLGVIPERPGSYIEMTSKVFTSAAGKWIRR